MKAHNNNWIEKLRAALDALDGIDMDPEHRRVYLRCVRAELYVAEETADELLATENSGTRWTDDEKDTIVAFLKGRVAHSWEEGDNTLTEIAAKLRRKKPSVKRKIIELGLTAAVDYFYVKSRGPL